MAGFISERPRFRRIELEWPVEVDGKTYATIDVVRLTAGDVEKFQSEISALRDKDPDAMVDIPIFRDADGQPLPRAVLAAMDDDDRFALDEAAVDFLPRRFRAAAATSRNSGENIAP